VVANRKTQVYFNSSTPPKPQKQFELTLQFIKKYADSTAKIIAIGCRDVSILSDIQSYAPGASLTGFDIRSKYLDKTEELKSWEIIPGSITDISRVYKLGGNYDICILDNILHLLTGRNRRESYQTACLSLRNAWRLLKPDSFLILIEPVFSPSCLMGAAFWSQKALNLFHFKCINLFGFDSPGFEQTTVSYYAEKQIRMMVEHLKGLRFLEKRIEGKTRLVGLIERMTLGMILHKVPAF